MCGHSGRGWRRGGAFAGAGTCEGVFGSFFGARGFKEQFFGSGADFRSWAGPSREEMIRSLEEYQKDMEQEIMDVQARIKELRQEKAEPSV